ncbi:MAG: hypothetical protein HY979_02135 [Candidatus Magasanikbacteria bacterium]|nr:hypothetical protein [Candidatus Magasanikbacteria bacterium]
MKKFFILALIIAFGLILAQVSLAQEQPATTQENQPAAVSSDVTATDLGVAEPTVLPSNRFGYFFKNLARAVQTTLTFNQVKKAELELKIANERLVEAQKVAEIDSTSAKTQAIVAKAQEKYQQLIEKVQTRVEKLKEKGDQRAEALLDKVTDRQLKQQQLMENLQDKLENLPVEQKERLEQVREKVLENFGQFLERVDENTEKVKERLDKVIESQNDNQLKVIRHLEVMERLGDKLQNENIKEGLTQAKEQLRDKMIANLKEQSSGANIQEFKENLQEVSGQEGYKLRVINFLDEGLDKEALFNRPLQQFRQTLEEVKVEQEDSFREKLESAVSTVEQSKLLESLQSGEVKSVEILERVKNKVRNEKAKEALEQAQEKQVEQFNERFEKMEKLEQVQELQKEMKALPAVQRIIRTTGPELFNKAEERLEQIKEKAESREKDGEKPPEAKDQGAIRPLPEKTINLKAEVDNQNKVIDLRGKAEVKMETPELKPGKPIIDRPIKKDEPPRIISIPKLPGVIPDIKTTNQPDQNQNAKPTEQPSRDIQRENQGSEGQARPQIAPAQPAVNRAEVQPVR